MKEDNKAPTTNEKTKLIHVEITKDNSSIQIGFSCAGSLGP